jgi:hypothetical protein
MSVQSDMDRRLPEETLRSKTLEPNEARQGEIILKTTLSRIVFIAGLSGGIVIVVAVALYLASIG